MCNTPATAITGSELTCHGAHARVGRIARPPALLLPARLADNAHRAWRAIKERERKRSQTRDTPRTALELELFAARNVPEEAHDGQHQLTQVYPSSIDIISTTVTLK